jgi:hypothetical protein
MLDNNPLFRDYQEVRRNIESKLASPGLILGHVVLFNLAVLALFAFTVLLNPAVPFYVPRSHFVDAGASYAMTAWSLLLVAHGLWVYRKSGADGGQRGRVIEGELEHRIKQGDTDLLDNPRQTFQIRGLLTEDVRLRSGVFVPILAFIFVNALTWAVWGIQGAYSSYTWTVTLPTTLAFLLPALVVNMVRRQRRNRRIMRLLDEDSAYGAPVKAKRTLNDDDEAVYHLSDDGELVAVEGDAAERKAKMRYD